MLSVVLMEYDMLKDMVYGFFEQNSGGFSPQKLLVILAVAVIGGGIFFFLMLSKSNNPFFAKIRELFKGVFEGLTSILKMEKKGLFLLHTVFIWVMYIGMFYVCFFSLEETSNVPLPGILAAFVMGSLAIVFVQGGLGVFPIAIMETLILYGITKTSALALGWILWTSQTLMIIVFGVLSIPLLRFVNRNKKIESTPNLEK